METKGFFQFEIIINALNCFGFIEYLCYGSTAIINILLFHCGIDIRRQNVTAT